MGPLIPIAISLASQLLSKHQQDVDFKKNLPLSILARSAASKGAPTNALQTQMDLNKQGSGSGLELAGPIASLVSSMGESGPEDQNAMYRDPSKTQEADFVNGRLRPDDELRGSGWARNWKPYGS